MSNIILSPSNPVALASPSPQAQYSLATSPTLISPNQTTLTQQPGHLLLHQLSSHSVGSLSPNQVLQNANTSTGMPSYNPSFKDTRWLTLEVCREFQRGKCNRTDNECKFAHPPSYVEINNGKVIACYDSLKVNILLIRILPSRSFRNESGVTR